jgi:hypothetical protein
MFTLGHSKFTSVRTEFVVSATVLAIAVALCLAPTRSEAGPLVGGTDSVATPLRSAAVDGVFRYEGPRLRPKSAWECNRL